MVGFPRQSWPSYSWINAAAATRVDVDGNVSSATAETMFTSKEALQDKDFEKASPSDDVSLGFKERAFSAAGAAVLSAVIVNPLDVAKTRLQAQAAGVPYQCLCGAECFGLDSMLPDIKSSVSRTGPESVHCSEQLCTSECNRYKGTLDVFFKVTRQEGFARLWRGTNASLALAIPTVGIYMPCYDIFRNFLEDFTYRHSPSLTLYVPLVAGSAARSLACVACYPIELARTRMQAFRETQIGVRSPGVWKTLIEVINPVRKSSNLQRGPRYRMLWTGLGAQLTRDVPFSAICWSSLEPMRRRIFAFVGDEARAATVLGANFSAGFVAGTLAAAATCPLDVARTRRQIEKDPSRALNMSTRKTLLEIWREGGTKGLFTGVGPRVARAGPSVGIVVSFYEVVKFALSRRDRSSQFSA